MFLFISTAHTVMEKEKQEEQNLLFE